jgi:ABC-type multidrug transport system ATPase subunit
VITAADMAAVRQQWPHWDDMTIRRHLQQRAALSQLAEQQRKQRLAECLREVFEVRQS